jgi:3-oxoacyl-[acyl-carrier-protein] synthase II
MPIHTAGEVDAEEFDSLAAASEAKSTDRGVMFGLIASREALKDAGLLDAAKDGLPVAAILGSGLGPCHQAEISYGEYLTRGWRGIRPTTIPRAMYSTLASQISIAYHLTGGHHVVAAACASGTLAMAEAYQAIRSGGEEVVLTGGVDSPLNRSTYGGWMNLRALSRNPDPARASRPFDRRRDGFVLAEGAGILIFEELERARARGAKIYGEIIGEGASSDATHLTQPDVQGQALAIRRALNDAGIEPEEVDYINAHGTGTPLNDPVETAAIKAALGEHARRVPISSTKSVIGHAMGASGALELIACFLAIQHQVVPPTVNLEEPDPECDLDYVPLQARPHPVRTVLSNSFAFGGSNAVLAVRAFGP